MNPMTNVKNIQKLNERMLDMGVADDVSWHKQYKDSAYVFIGGLPYDLTEGDILCVFSQYGEIVNINLVRDKKTGKQKGFCFLCYEDQRSTILAVDNFNGIKLGGRTIRVDHCSDYRRPKSDEKDEDGKRKEIIEEGCAPKTPSPSQSEDEEYMEPVKKKKKSKKEKKHKIDKERKDKIKKKEYLSESDSDQLQNLKKYSAKDSKGNLDRNTSPVQVERPTKDTYQKSGGSEDVGFDQSRYHGKNIQRTHTLESSHSKARKREYEESNKTQSRGREWEGKRNIHKSDQSDRKRNEEDKEYRSYDHKNKTRFDRDEHDGNYNDYKRSRRDADYERERERKERKGNRR